MLEPLLLAALVAQERGTAAARETQTPSVVVAAPVYHPDGSVRAETVVLPATPSVVYFFARQTLCDAGTSSANAPAAAAFGWRVASHVVSASAGEAVVSVDWRRAWDRGAAVTDGPGGTVQLTLHPGDRIPLDHIPNAQPDGACPAVGMGLEVKLARASAAAPAPGSTAPTGAVEGGGRAFDADLWLIHTSPAGAQQVQHQRVRMSNGRAAFNFAPSAVAGPRGETSVEFAGSLVRYRTPAGEELLMVSMSRAIAGGDAPQGGLTRQTSTLTTLPGPADVLSVEMPTSAGRAGGGVFGSGGGRGGARVGSGPPSGGSGQVSGGGAARGGGRGGVAAGGATAQQAVAMLEGHAFSVRVRLTPVN